MTVSTGIVFFTFKVNDIELNAAIDFNEHETGLTKPNQINDVLEKATTSYQKTIEVVDDRGIVYRIDNDEYKNAIDWAIQDIWAEFKETVKQKFNIVLKDENYIESEGIDFKF